MTSKQVYSWTTDNSLGFLQRVRDQEARPQAHFFLGAVPLLISWLRTTGLQALTMGWHDDDKYIISGTLADGIVTWNKVIAKLPHHTWRGNYVQLLKALIWEGK